MLLSIVSPVYRAEKILPELIRRCKASVLGITDHFELILVDDASPDGSWSVIEEFASSDLQVKGIKLSKNFGQHYAITAGLEQAKGDWVVVMDCDLQDRPEEIPALWRKALEGYEVVLARRANRKDNPVKKIASQFFYSTLNYMTGSKFDFSVANFGVYSRKTIDAFISMREHIRVFPIMVNWMGFPTAKLDVTHDFRFEGKSSYTFKKKANLALDIILAYSDKPIRLAIKAGFGLSLFSFLFAILTLIRFFSGQIEVSGYTSIIISISFFSGIIIMILGIVGLYIGKIFEGVKARPLYLIDKKVNA
jgi:polyisoprenyl-phosphate glycosyltransferase